MFCVIQDGGRIDDVFMRACRGLGYDADILRDGCIRRVDEPRIGFARSDPGEDLADI